MEAHPYGIERLLNARLSEFARKVLEDDTCAVALVRLLQRHTGLTDSMELLAGEPSICEADDSLLAGIQVGFRRKVGNGTETRYLYADFFRFDETTGAHVPTELFEEATCHLTDDDRTTAIEGAWRIWLGALRELVSSMDGGDLCRDAYTGEVSLSDNMPPGHARPLTLPSL